MRRKVSAQQSNSARQRTTSSNDELRSIRHKSRLATTFKGGLDRPAHRWFRLTPSYSPDVVTELLQEFGSATSTVLDPFCGRGTTPIQCQLQNVACVGIEINPLLQFAGRVSLNWSVPADAAEQALAICLKSIKSTRPRSLQDLETFACDLNVNFPRIHNVYRWWRPDVLADLLCIKSAVLNSGFTSDLRDLLKLALAGILLDSANITLRRLQLHFIDRAADEIDPTGLFQSAAEQIIQDLNQLNGLIPDRPSQILHSDSTGLEAALPIPEASIDLVITSPPYPNRYSYVWNTRPHLYFLDFMNTPTEAGQLDCSTVGGTWGTATSRHQKGEYAFKNQHAAAVLEQIVAEIRGKDALMANYVAMYFDDLCSHIKTISPLLRKGAVCAYVVGNSRIKKSIVCTDELLQSLFVALGYEPIRLEEIRRRNSGAELHETIVITRKT